jgi:menaquinone-dependent protoporphyrinogen IX oxidase
MKTIIIYDSKRGTTETCAFKIKEALKCDAVSLRDNHDVSVTDYDMTIIGTPIYAGQTSRLVKNFCASNENILKNKKLAFFVCGLDDPVQMIEAFKKAIPTELANNALIISHFGGELHPERAKFLMKFIMKKMLESKDTKVGLNEHEITSFINRLKEVK